MRCKASPAHENALAEGLTRIIQNQLKSDAWQCSQHSDSRTKATAHSGILRAAKGVVDDLVHEGVLAALMEGQPVPPTNRKTPDCRCAHFVEAPDLGNCLEASWLDDRGKACLRQVQDSEVPCGLCPHKALHFWLFGALCIQQSGLQVEGSHTASRMNGGCQVRFVTPHGISWVWPHPWCHGFCDGEI